MEYHKKDNHWTDIGSNSGCLHNILAWTDEIIPCEVDNFEYIAGELVEKE